MKWIVEAESIDDIVLGNYSINDTPLTECKDCKYHHYERNIPYCANIDYGYGWKDSDFCSKAERKDND